MTYFQNPFSSEFRGNWSLSDRQHSLTFVCPGNSGRSDEVVFSWQEPTSGVFDLSGNDSDGNPRNVLKIRFTVNNGDFWSNIEVDLTDNTNALLDPAPIDSQMSPYQIVSIMNRNPSFSSYFVANTEKNKIIVKQKFPISRMKYFIINGGAEESLKFNARAGVAELPSYFERSKIWGGDMSFPMDGINSLVILDPTNTVDSNVIDYAVDSKGLPLNYDSGVVREDYELLEGRASGLFTFQKLTVDGSDRVTQIIEYPAGAKIGDLARKINYVFSGSNKNPDKVTEIPYLLKSSDIVTP